MYSILLADDEPIIIRGLKKMIQWEKLNATIVGEAFSGNETLAKVRKLKPDILISDISMPQKTGLEILKIIKEEELETKVIFISAFQEFKYAKEALKYGAIEYLLKPLQQNELEEAVLKAQQVLKKDYHIEIPKNKDKIQNKLQIDEGYHNDLCQKFKDMGVDIKEKRFVSVCFTIKPDYNIYDGTFELLRFSIYKRIQKYLVNSKVGFTIKPDDDKCNLIFVLPSVDFNKSMEIIVKETIHMIQSEYNIAINAGIGDVIDKLEDLEYAYKTAKFASELHYFHNINIIQYRKIKKTYISSIDDFNNKYRDLLDGILSQDNNYHLLLDEIIRLVYDLHYGNKYAVVNRCIQFSMDLFKDLLEYKLVEEKEREVYERFLNELRSQPDYNSLKVRFLYFFDKFIKNIIEGNSIRESSIIIQVKEHIKKHFSEDISLKQVSELACMNSYYFSSFFKKETGTNFKQYLTQIRMKEAVKLLMDTDMKTYAIAKSVGYNDVRHFTEKFKEIYGESPNGYKKTRKNNVHF